MIILPAIDLQGGRCVRLRQERADDAVVGFAGLWVMVDEAHVTTFAVDPRWLVHLPPTMSPVATSALPDVLEGSLDQRLQVLETQLIQTALRTAKGNKSEIWTAGIHGETPTFRALGSQPRFSPNNFQVIYTHTDIEGKVDLRRMDIRDGSSESITDSPEVDFQPDWSPDGRSYVFAAMDGSATTIWQVPATGGKRVQVMERGYFPRFSSDGKNLVYWNNQSLWTAASDGKNPRAVRDHLPLPTPSAWLKGKPMISTDMEISGGTSILPTFDVLPDGRILTAKVVSQDTALWTVDLTYVDK